MKKIFCLALAILAVAIFSSAVFSEDQPVDKVKMFFSTSYISPENEANYTRGLDAANRAEWSLAARYFLEAQKKAHYYAPLLFNLGLSNEKAGNDLAAIAWFRAYLAASPRDKNTASILEEIKKIKNSIKEKSNKIYSELYNATNQIPDDGYNRESAYMGIAEAQAEAGDFETAYQTLAKSRPDFDRTEKDFRPLYAKTLARLGDFKKTWEILTKYESEKKENKSPDTWVFMGEQLLAIGDLTGAWKALRQGKDSYAFEFAASELLDKKIKEGDIIFAEEIYKTKPTKTMASSLAVKKAKDGDIKGAEFVVASLSNQGDMAEVLLDVAIELWKKGDYDNARRLAKRILTMSDQLDKYQETVTAVANAIAGDYEEALFSTSMAFFNDISRNNHSKAYGQIAYISILEGKDNIASEALDLSMDDPEDIYKSVFPQQYIAMAYLDMGKLDIALEEAKKIDQVEGPRFYGDTIAKIAGEYIKKGEIKTGEELIKLAGFTGQGWVEVRLTPREMLIKEFLAKKDLPKVIELYEEAIDYIHNMIKEFRGVDRFIELERIMKEEAKIGIEKKYINKELGEWVLAARIINDCLNLDDDLKNARNPYDGAPAEFIIKLTAGVAKRMQIGLLKLEQMEKGNFEGRIGSFIKAAFEN